MIKEGSSGNLKVYYVIDGKLSIYINRELMYSKTERIDFIAFETIFQFYLRMKAVHIAPVTIKQELLKLWAQVERDREEYIKAIVSGNSNSLTKAKPSVIGILEPFAALIPLKATASESPAPVEEKPVPVPEQVKEVSKPLALIKSVSAPVMREMMAVGLQDKIFQAIGTVSKDGWYKIPSEFRISALSRFVTYSMVDKIAPLDEKTGSKVKFQPQEFVSPYKLADLELDWLLSEEENQRPYFNHSLNTTFMDLSTNIDARMDLIFNILGVNKRLPPLICKRFLGKRMDRSLESCEVFGERALESKGARSASVISEAKCM